MQCPKCLKEIVSAEYGYCPHCGKALKVAGKREQSLRRRLLRNFLLWFVSCILLFGLIFAIGFLTYTYMNVSSDWLLPFYVVLVITGFYIAGADVIYHHAKRYGRNAVAWMTASILFTPILTAIAYGLTWPKTQQEEG